ncbi:hypothetical protein [Streptomyces sp. NPDC056796]|uniref:hypothetical protein n=1 Tax=Streptomyces sp. NPDC056796 TaxID=3345947 RepID=UPI003681BB37
MARWAPSTRQAAELFTPAIQPGRHPYEDTTLPCYLYRPDDAALPRPTVVMSNGFDGATEEMRFFGAAAAVERERGYTVLVLAAPGHPGTRHHQQLMFRPDWENVVTPVLDFTETLPEADPERMAVFGAGTDGYLAQRLAPPHSTAGSPPWSRSTESSTSATSALPPSRCPAPRPSAGCGPGTTLSWTPR